MEFSQLQYFLATAKYKQITRASEMLYVSQSTVSMAISRLEEELGTRLFERSGRSLTLTEAGLEFSRLITPAIAALGSAAAEQEKPDARNTQIIRLTVEVPDIVTCLLGSYLSLVPDAEAEQVLDDAETWESRLLSDGADLAITIVPPKDDRLSAELLFAERAQVLLSTANPLSSRTRLSLSELADSDFISFNGAFSINRWITELGQKAGFTPLVRTQVCDGHSLAYALANRPECVSLVGEITGARALQSSQFVNLRSSLRVIPLTEEFCVRNIYVCRRKEGEIPPASAQFLRFLLAVRDQTRILGRLPERREIPPESFL